MPLLSPIHGLVIPFLCFVTIPLAVFAGITTVMAFSILIVFDGPRPPISPQFAGSPSAPAEPEPVSALSPDVFRAGAGSKSTSALATSLNPQASGYTLSGYRTPTRRRLSGSAAVPSDFLGRRSRHSSQASLHSGGTISPIHEDEIPTAMSGSGVLPSVGLDRDYEGIGGWRLDERDDEPWTSINSRLELPSERGVVRHHQRPPSGGPVTPGEGWLTMKGVHFDTAPERERRQTLNRRDSSSPNSRRARLNQSGQGSSSWAAEDSYFSGAVVPKVKNMAPSGR